MATTAVTDTSWELERGLEKGDAKDLCVLNEHCHVVQPPKRIAPSVGLLGRSSS
jgi:hypothetical protein